MKRIVKNDLINSVVNKLKNNDVKITKNMVETIINSLVETVISELKNGNEVYINGLGIFKPVKKPATVKKNNLYGETIKLPERTVLRFKPSQKIKVLKVGK